MKKNKPIKCFQCYSFGRTYLLLTASVKAIIPLMAYQSSHTLNDWHLGSIAWEGRCVPIINLALKGKPVENLPHSHIMILQCLSEQVHAYIGVVTAQIARPVEIEEGVLVFDGAPDRHLYPVKGAQMIGEIVDMKSLSAQLVHDKIIE